MFIAKHGFKSFRWTTDTFNNVLLGIATVNIFIKWFLIMWNVGHSILRTRYSYDLEMYTIPTIVNYRIYFVLCLYKIKALTWLNNKFFLLIYKFIVLVRACNNIE